MSYGIDSAKPAHLTFGYALDYDKEIQADLAEIAYLSSDAAKAFAAVVEAQHEAGNRRAQGMLVIDCLFYAPELYSLLGLTLDEARGMFVCWGADHDRIPALYGPVTDARADHAVGWDVLERPGPNSTISLEHWRPRRETGGNGRAHSLKVAKARLSRHKRNAKKYGKK